MDIEYVVALGDNGKAFALKVRGNAVLRSEVCISTGEAIKILADWKAADKD